MSDAGNSDPSQPSYHELQAERDQLRLEVERLSQSAFCYIYVP